MADPLPLLAVFAASFAGLRLVARSQARDRRGDDALPPGRRRHAGLGLCCVSLGLALLRYGPACGAIVWLLSLSAASLVAAGGLGWRRKK